MNPGDASPEALMARFRERIDPAAMEGIVAGFMAPALTAARQILASESLAEDAVQETFLRLVRHPCRYDPGRPFSHWFYAVLRNACRDLMRRRSRRAEVERSAAVPEHTSPSDDSEDLQLLLVRLPAEEKTVLILRLKGGLSFEEIGAFLGISLEAAKKRAQRGLQRLREMAVPSGPARA